MYRNLNPLKHKNHNEHSYYTWIECSFLWRDCCGRIVFEDNIVCPSDPVSVGIRVVVVVIPLDRHPLAVRADVSDHAWTITILADTV